jgi:hypothetical protein
MTPRKSQRARKPITIWEEKKAPPAASDPKITKKIARIRPETALRPIATGPLLDACELDEFIFLIYLHTNPPSNYALNPLNRVPQVSQSFKSSKSYFRRLW